MDLCLVYKYIIYISHIYKPKQGQPTLKGSKALFFVTEHCGVCWGSNPGFVAWISSVWISKCSRRLEKEWFWSGRLAIHGQITADTGTNLVMCRAAGWWGLIKKTWQIDSWAAGGGCELSRCWLLGFKVVQSLSVFLSIHLSNCTRAAHTPQIIKSSSCVDNSS